MKEDNACIPDKERLEDIRHLMKISPYSGLACNHEEIAKLDVEQLVPLRNQIDRLHKFRLLLDDGLDEVIQPPFYYTSEEQKGYFYLWTNPKEFHTMKHCLNDAIIKRKIGIRNSQHVSP